MRAQATDLRRCPVCEQRITARLGLRRCTRCGIYVEFGARDKKMRRRAETLR